MYFLIALFHKYNNGFPCKTIVENYLLWPRGLAWI